MSLDNFIKYFIPKHTPQKSQASVFAPTNIALIKYWGKRDPILNLPVTDSLSITLPGHGTTTQIEVTDALADQIYLNNTLVDTSSIFYRKTTQFINLFRHQHEHFLIKTNNNIPTAAGLASSASGFAALTLALDEIYQWQFSKTQLSILARLGSGSACRSFWPGFVIWHRGHLQDGSDSHGTPLTEQWPGLCIGLLFISEQAKSISSRDAMNITVATSPLYPAWPNAVASHLTQMITAITAKDFTNLGHLAEQNALSMHATMQSAWPPIYYSTSQTLETMKKIWDLRQQGLEIYFTQDAGANLKLLFLEENKNKVLQHFPQLEISQTTV